ncbi:MAG TPA: Maf family protein [Verrucomicrobiae bacterium]|jgi:septum formation protein|nr:Maf family protein [Verrucomicrobiae bacterium]
MKLPPVILASSSPRRTKLLKKLIAEFTVIPSDAEELHNEELTAVELSQINAYRKARAVAKRFPDALVIGADTLVSLGSALFGKPANHEDAHRMLKQLRGRTHQVVTGVCLLQLRGHRQKMFAERTQVKFRPLSAKAIREYLKLINPLDKAGAYAIQDYGDKIVENISGSLTNVIGLPTERLRRELKLWSEGG